MSIFRQDPGPCPVCGAAHSACTTDPGPIAVVQLPARDAAVLRAAGVPSPVPPGVLSPAPTDAPAPAPALKADAVQAALGPNEFTSATYRKGRRR